jgi:hypothetical protein
VAQYAGAVVVQTTSVVVIDVARGLAITSS